MSVIDSLAKARGRRRRQQGIVLPVVLILLVVLGVLGISGMDDTAMQERMSGNLRDRDIAFQAAESALRQGESVLQANPAAMSANVPIAGIAGRVWDGVAPAPSGTLAGLYGPGDPIALFANPSFYVGPADLVRINPGETPPVFREIHPVIARSFGATDTTLVVLRSTFEPL
jgi:type IV pilus assembly protein PilX